MEKSRKHVGIAREYWAVAGVDDRIELSIGPAMDTLNHLLPTHHSTVDFAFIDADKGNYVNYYNLCLQLLRQGGILALDNTLFKVL